ncbi:MAG TPA: hypothetical protein VJ728_18160 [Candidatus Binataceae bacterium]|nr:hypothetical protein [Candidatus Binataceae bacterium]
MKLARTLPAFALMLGLGVASASPVFAADVARTSTMTNYAQNARTAEDHEHIASIYDLQADNAESVADSYATQFKCQHSRAAELQSRGAQFAGVTAQRQCRKMLWQYTKQAQQLRELADYHRDVADHWRAHSL